MSGGRNNHNNITDPVYPNPSFWVILNQFMEIFGKTEILNIECAAFDHLSQRYADTSGDETVIAFNRSDIKKKSTPNANQRQLQHDNFRRQEKNNPLVKQRTFYYGATQHPEVMEAYFDLHPHLQNDTELKEDLKNLQDYINNPDPKKELPEAKSKNILLIEYWRNIPEIVTRRRIAHERFSHLYLSYDAKKGHKVLRQDMLQVLVKDAKKFFSSRPSDLTIEVDNLEALFEAYFANPNNPAALIEHLSNTSNTNDNKELRAKNLFDAFKFLEDEIIDVIAMQRFKKPSHPLIPSEIPAKEEERPFVRICHSKPNNAMNLILEHSNVLGLEIPMPEHWFIPYLVVSRQVSHFFNSDNEFKDKFKSEDFEPKQAAAINSIHQSVIAKLSRAARVQTRSRRIPHSPRSQSEPASRTCSPPDHPTLSIERTSSVPNLLGGNSTTTDLFKMLLNAEIERQKIEKQRQEIIDRLTEELEVERQRLEAAQQNITALQQLCSNIKQNKEAPLSTILQQLTTTQKESKPFNPLKLEKDALSEVRNDLESSMAFLMSSGITTFSIASPTQPQVTLLPKPTPSQSN